MTEIENKRRTEIKTVYDGLVRWLCMGEERLSELEKGSLESSEPEQQREQWLTKLMSVSKDCGTTTTDRHVNFIKRRKREREKRKTEEIFETKIDNFSKLISDTRPNIQEAHSVARTSPSV